MEHTKTVIAICLKIYNFIVIKNNLYYDIQILCMFRSNDVSPSEVDAMIYSVEHLGDGVYRVVMNDGSIVRCDRETVATLNNSK